MDMADLAREHPKPMPEEETTASIASDATWATDIDGVRARTLGTGMRRSQTAAELMAGVLRGQGLGSLQEAGGGGERSYVYRRLRQRAG